MKQERILVENDSITINIYSDVTIEPDKHIDFREHMSVFFQACVDCIAKMEKEMEFYCSKIFFFFFLLRGVRISHPSCYVY